MAKALVVSTKFTAVDKFSQTMQRMTAATNTFASKTKAAMARASRAMRSLQTFTGGVINKIFNLRNAAVLMIGAMAVKKTIGMASGIAQVGDEAAKTGRQIGITAETLQELRFAADRQGVSSETLTKSLQLLNRNVGDVQAGQGTLTTMLKRTNPALLKQLLNVENNEQAFELMINAISNAPNQLQKVSLASAAFGRSGQEMLKLLEAGPDGMMKLREEARKLGGIISNEAAISMEKFIDVQTNMKFALQGLKTTIGVELIPIIQKATENITKWILENRDLIKIKVSEYIQKIINAAIWIRDNFTKIAGVIKFVAIALGSLIAVNIVLNTVMAITNVIAAANPFVLITLAVIGLIAGIIALIRNWSELVNWIKTSDNFFAKLIRGALKPIIWIIDGISAAWKRVKEAFAGGGIWGAIKSIGKSILSFLLAPLEAILIITNKLTKGKVGGEALAKMQAFRAELTASPEVQQEALNPEAAIEQVRTERIEKTKNEKVNIGVTAMPGTKAQILEDTTNQVQLTPTLGWTQ